MENKSTLMTRGQRREKLDRIVELGNAALAEKGWTHLAVTRKGDQIIVGPAGASISSEVVGRVNSTD